MTIGFFDSGIGGHFIMDSVVRALPQYDYVFFGDTANVPYGDKSEEAIYELTRQAVVRLMGEYDAKLVVLACNTASAETLRRLQDFFLPAEYPDRRILGVIIPTIETLLAGPHTKPLLIATQRTINSRKYERELELRGVTLDLVACATPHLVPLIEAGKLEEACDSITDLIDTHLSHGGDALILGCTHYGMLAPQLRARYGERLRIIAQNEIIPPKLADYLQRHPEIERDVTRGGSRQVMWSGGVTPTGLTQHDIR